MNAFNIYSQYKKVTKDLFNFFEIDFKLSPMKKNSIKFMCFKFIIYCRWDLRGY